MPLQQLISAVVDDAHHAKKKETHANNTKKETENTKNMQNKCKKNAKIAKKQKNRENRRQKAKIKPKLIKFNIF